MVIQNTISSFGLIDLLSISKENKTLNLIQCKNWNKKEIHFSDINNI